MEVAREKMLIKADLKDLKFEQKLEQEDKRAMQQTGKTVRKCTTESGWWALGSISLNKMRGECDSGRGDDVGWEGGQREDSEPGWKNPGWNDRGGWSGSGPGSWNNHCGWNWPPVGQQWNMSDGPEHGAARYYCRDMNCCGPDAHEGAGGGLEGRGAHGGCGAQVQHGYWQLWRSW